MKVIIYNLGNYYRKIGLRVFYLFVFIIFFKNMDKYVNFFFFIYILVINKVKL